MGSRGNRGVRRITTADMNAAFGAAGSAKTALSDLEQADANAQRGGSDDKIGAVVAETALPKVKTVTSAGADWLNADPHGMKRVGLFGQRGRFAIQYQDLERRAQFLGRPLDVVDLEEVHGVDDTAPETALCTTCNKEISSFVKTAMIDDKGDLVKDTSGSIVYRGQFVVVGRPLAVPASHTGEDCLFHLRNARRKKKQLPNGRMVPDLLPSQSFAQANARLTGIQSHLAQKSQADEGMRGRLGLSNEEKVGNGFGNRPFRNASHQPTTPRGWSRNDRRS